MTKTKFYNQSGTKIEELKNYEIKEFQLDVPSLYGIKYFEELDAAIQDFINKIISTKPTLIVIVGDFGMLEKANKNDILDFIDTIVSFFVDALIENDSRTNAERHFLYNKLISKSNLNEFSKRKVRNFKTRLESWNILVKNKKEKVLYEVF
ncbi:MAG: hypothetical protein ACOC1K_08210 [Nanoarchaeota archaeon]